MAATVIEPVVHYDGLVQLRGESYRVRRALMQEGWEVIIRRAPCSDSGAHFAQMGLAKHSLARQSSWRGRAQKTIGVEPTWCSENFDRKVCDNSSFVALL